MASSRVASRFLHAKHLTAVRFSALPCMASYSTWRMAPVNQAGSPLDPSHRYCAQFRGISTTCTLMKITKKKRPKKVKEEVVESDDEVTDDDDDDEDEERKEEDEGVAKDYKERTIGLNSPRLDLLLGRALNKGRAAIEEMFYAGRFKVNGVIAKKKAANIHDNDEIDFLIGPSPDNPEFSVVTRIKVVSYDLRSATKTGLFPVEVRIWPALVVTDWKEEPEKED